MKTRLAVLLFSCLCLVGLVMALAGQPEQPPKRKLEIFANYEKQTADHLKTIAAAVKEGKTPDKSTVEMVKMATDDTFKVLQVEQFMTARLGAYEGQWKGIRNTKDDLAFGKKVVPFVKSFTVAGQDGANKVSTCTIVVSASKGDNAVIRYIKAADLAQGGKFKELGVTVVIQDVERAEYVFKSFRKDVETGSTEGVTCTDAKKPVKITIQEK